MKIFFEILKWLGIFLLSCVLYIGVVTFIGKVIFKNDIPLIFNYGYITVDNSNETVEYKMGDLLIIKKADDYNLGEYILYLKSDKIKIEMITEKKADSYITIDENNQIKNEIPASYIKAKVVKPLASIGKFLAFITSKHGIFIVLLAFAVFMYFQRKHN